MKSPLYLFTFLVSVVCIFLCIVVIYQGHTLSGASEAFEKNRATVTNEINGAQAEINRGNQSYQYISTIVNQIEALTDETKKGVRDDKLKSLLAKDVESSGFIKITEPSPAPSPAASPATSSTSH